MKSHASPRPFRQTLLPFQSINPAGSLPVSPKQTSHALPKPAPVLPWEILDLILESLEPIHLKTFRLICREWSVLGAKRLFSTLYLNRFVKCWSGLIAVSESSYATLVERIEWNPVVLPDPLDLSAWSSRYQSLISDLTYHRALLLNLRYCNLELHLGNPMAPFPIGIVADALAKLTNCHEIIVSEDYGLEARRSDPHFRRLFLKENRISKHPSIWACRPHWWSLNDRDIANFGTLHGLLNAAARCSTITHLTVDLEPANFNSMAKCQTLYHCQHIKSLMLRLRYSPTLDARPLIEEPLVVMLELQDALQLSISWVQSFPKVYDLHIEVKLEDPWPDLADFIMQDMYGLDDSENSDDPDDPDDSDNTEDLDNSDDLNGSDDSMNSAHMVQTALRGKPRRNRNLPINFYDVLFVAETTLRSFRLQNLRTLRLTNITIDVRYLLHMACMYPHPPDSPLSIHLTGTTILYGLQTTFFLDLLNRLNVQLHYEPIHTYHYVTHVKNYRSVPCLQFSFIGLGSRVDGWSFGLHYGAPSEPLNMPSLPESNFQKGLTEFRHYVSDLTDFALSHKTRALEVPNKNLCFAYQIRFEDGHIICEWVIDNLDVWYDPTQEPYPANIPILEIDAFFDPEDEDDEAEEDAYTVAHRVNRELLLGSGYTGDQILLRLFEVEYLGLDVVEIRSAADRRERRLQDGSLLTQYEVEYLGLDLMWNGRMENADTRFSVGSDECWILST